MIAPTEAPSEREASLSGLLAAAERALAADAEGRLRAAGYPDLRAAHVHVFAALPVEGCRLTTLAIRAGMTKQAMGELVRYLQGHGYLDVRPDLNDRRAKVIRLTGEGRRAREHSLAVLAAGESRLVDRIGKRGLDELRERLREIAQDR